MGNALYKTFCDQRDLPKYQMEEQKMLTCGNRVVNLLTRYNAWRYRKVCVQKQSSWGIFCVPSHCS